MSTDGDGHGHPQMQGGLAFVDRAKQFQQWQQEQRGNDPGRRGRRRRDPGSQQMH